MKIYTAKGESDESVRQRLSPIQSHALNEVAQKADLRREEERRAKASAAARLESLKTAALAAFDSGVPARLIAAEAGLSTGRIHQWTAERKKNKID